MRHLLLATATAAAATFASFPAQAVVHQFVATLLGTNEVSGGDPDGSGTAYVEIDTVTGVFSWEIETSNIDPITMAHIHQGVAGTNGPVRVDFMGMLMGSTTNATWAALITPDTTMVGTSGFYVNLHNAAHPGGAIRGQLEFVQTIPEPGTWALMALGLGAVGVVARRRRAG
jgi:hypothetical protein